MGPDRSALMRNRLTWPTWLPMNKEGLLWILGGLASLIICLIVTFPYGALQSRLLTEFQAGTGWDARAAGWSPGFPLAIEWRDLTVSKPGRPSVQVESARIGISLLGQLTGHRSIEGVIALPGAVGGRLTGTVKAADWSFQGPTSVTGQAQQLDLAQIVKPFVTKGLLKADVTQGWVGVLGGVLFKGDGSWKAEIRDLTLEQIPIGPSALPPLTFTHVSIRLSCRDAACEVTEFKGDGPDGSITAQGSLALQQPLQQTGLQLTVTVVGGQGWTQKSAGLPLPPLPPGVPITFKLMGTVANPRVSV